MTPLPTREAHELMIRRLWRWCIVGAGTVFVVTGSTAGAMFLLGYDSKTIANVSTVIFQVILLPYGLGYVAPALATSLLKMALGVEISREGLDLGRNTATTLTELRADVKPILEDAKSVLGSVRDLVEDVKSQNPKRIVEFIEKLAHDGTVEKIAKSVEKVADRVHEALTQKEFPSPPGAKPKSREEILTEVASGVWGYAKHPDCDAPRVTLGGLKTCRESKPEMLWCGKCFASVKEEENP